MSLRGRLNAGCAAAMVLCAMSAAAERHIFESRLDVEGLHARNLKVEFASAPVTYRIYFHADDGTVDSLVYEPSVNIDITVQTVVRNLSDPRAESHTDSPPPETPGARYAYEYIIKSEESSAQPVRRFVVHMALERGTALWVTNPDNWYSSKPKKNRPNSSNWVGWGASPRQYIHPGKCLGGFELRAPGIPGILEAFAQGKTTQTNYLNEMVYSAGGVDSNVVAGAVVGPVPEPEAFVPVDFCRHIEELYRQCVELGWINAPELAATVLTSLDAARTSLVSGRTEAGRGHLAGAVAHVLNATESGTTERVFTSEAEGLLTANISYLLDRI